jgi:hypothetical protein
MAVRPWIVAGLGISSHSCSAEAGSIRHNASMTTFRDTLCSIRILPRGAPCSSISRRIAALTKVRKPKVDAAAATEPDLAEFSS